MPDFAEEEPKTRRPRASRAKEPSGPVRRREMTQIRDTVGEIGDKLRSWDLSADNSVSVSDETIKRSLELDISALWTRLDRLDLRFKIHHDLSAKAAK